MSVRQSVNQLHVIVVLIINPIGGRENEKNRKAPSSSPPAPAPHKTKQNKKEKSGNPSLPSSLFPLYEVPWTCIIIRYAPPTIILNNLGVALATNPL